MDASPSLRNYHLVYPLGPGRIYKAAPQEKGMIPDEETLVRDYLYRSSSPDDVSPFEQFIGEHRVGFSFFPTLEPESTLTDGYLKTVRDGATAEAALELRKELLAISDGIREREEATKGLLPEYTILDPRKIPYYTYI